MSLEDAKTIAAAIGYRIEVLIPETKINSWGETEETGWVITPSSYDPRKINVELNENGEVASISRWHECVASAK